MQAVQSDYRITYGDWAKIQLETRVFGSIEFEQINSRRAHFVASKCNDELCPSFFVNRQSYSIETWSRRIVFELEKEFPSTESFAVAFDILSQLPFLLNECEESLSAADQELFAAENASLHSILIMTSDSFSLDIYGEYDSITDFNFVNWSLQPGFGMSQQ